MGNIVDIEKNKNVEVHQIVILDKNVSVKTAKEDKEDNKKVLDV